MMESSIRHRDSAGPHSSSFRSTLRAQNKIAGGGNNKGKKTLLILGKAGAGKSSTANSILGLSSFGVAHSFISTDLDCEAHENDSIRVVCAPDLQHKKFLNPEFDKVKEVESWLEKTYGEPDAVIVVIRCDERLTPQDSEAYEKYRDLLQNISRKVSKGEEGNVIATANYASERTCNERERQKKELLLKRRADDLQININNQQQTLAAKEAKIRKLQASMRDKDAEINRLSKELRHHTSELTSLRSERKNIGTLVHELHKLELRHHTSELTSLRSERKNIGTLVHELHKLVSNPMSTMRNRPSRGASDAKFRLHQVAMDDRDAEIASRSRVYCDVISSNTEGKQMPAVQYVPSRAHGYFKIPNIQGAMDVKDAEIAMLSEHVEQNSLLEKLVIVFTAGDRLNGKDLRQGLESDDPGFEHFKDIWTDAQKRYVVFDNTAKGARNDTQVKALMDLVATMKPHPFPQHTCRLLFLGSKATLGIVQSELCIKSGGVFGPGPQIFDHFDLDGLHLEVTFLRLDEKSSTALKKVKVAMSPGPHAILVLSDARTANKELSGRAETIIHTSFCSSTEGTGEYIRKFIRVVDTEQYLNHQALTALLKAEDFPTRKLSGEYFRTDELGKIAEQICEETMRRTETPGEPAGSSYDTYLAVKIDKIA